MEKVIKVTLAILLFTCFADVPYGYFQLIRFIALVGFSILAYFSNQKENEIEAIIYIGLAVLFQPLFKISLGRTIWNIVDLVVGIWLIISIFKKAIQFNRNEK